MKVLPPGLQSLSSHTFGSLFIQASDLRLNKTQQLTHFKPIFFGQNTDENTNLSNRPAISSSNTERIGSKMHYKIVTNLWLFFTYLSDMQNLDIQLFCPNSRASGCLAKAQLNLKPVKNVMVPAFDDKNIFQSSEDQRQTIVDSNGNVIGSINIKIWTEFDIALHEQIKQLIDFTSMIVFEGISPINSQNQLPRQPPQQISSVMSQIHQKSQFKSLNSQISNSKQPFQLHESQIREGDGLNQHRMIEQDIDKLIMEIQSRPYDSSRYQQTKNQPIKSSTGANLYEAHSQSHLSSFNKTSEHDFRGSNKFLQTQASLKHIPSRPPTYSPFSKNRSQSTRIENKTVISNSSQRIVKGQNLASRSYSQTFPRSNDSYIELRIHEMQFSLSNAIPQTMFSQLVQPCYTMKIYLNNDLEQYFAGQGVKEGEIIKFNLSLKLRNINNIQKIRFSICDDYGKVQSEGIFDLSRLYTSNNQKGVYIISLLPIASTQFKAQIKMAQNKLVQVSPLIRTLRIQAELIQRVEMVQIFMKISKITVPFNIIRYKIPLTKQTIQHVGGSHINIFPHSCSTQISDKIIVEFWKNDQNIGQSQISLKNIRNVNINTLNSNIDPTYLFDGKKQIRNILEGDRMVGDFNLTLCFGTVKQMQLLLVSAIDQQKQASRSSSTKIEATIDERLGVIVYNRPAQSNQVSIQVQLQQQKIDVQVNKAHQQILKFNEPSFGDQSMISHTSQNQFMDASIVSFAKNHPFEQIIKTEQQGKKKIILPTVTQKISQMVSQLLLPICQKLPKIKQLCKSHLLYNFISVDTLTQILTKLDFKMKLISKILKIAVFPKENMININILYDLCASISIQGNIKPHFVNDEMLIVGAMRLLYKNQSTRKQIIIEYDMQFKEMVALFQKVHLKLTMHQFQTLQKFMSNYKTKKQAQNLKRAIIDQLQEQTMAQLKQGFYEEDILKQIYGNQSSMSQSQFSDLNQPIQPIQSANIPINDNKSELKETQPILKPTMLSNQNNNEFVRTNKQQNRYQIGRETTQNKQKQSVNPYATTFTKSPAKEKSIHKCKLTIDGVQNVFQSAQCVFDQLPNNLSFRIIIDSPVFQQLNFKQTQRAKEFQANQELKDVDGRAEFIGNGKVLACAAFSLIRGVDSLYPMKTKDGHFCGLLKIKLQ